MPRTATAHVPRTTRTAAYPRQGKAEDGMMGRYPKHKHEWEFYGHSKASELEECRICVADKDFTWPHMILGPAIIVAIGLLIGLLFR